MLVARLSLRALRRRRAAAARHLVRDLAVDLGRVDVERDRHRRREPAEAPEVVPRQGLRILGNRADDQAAARETSAPRPACSGRLRADPRRTAAGPPPPRARRRTTSNATSPHVTRTRASGGSASGASAWPKSGRSGSTCTGVCSSACIAGARLIAKPPATGSTSTWPPGSDADAGKYAGFAGASAPRAAPTVKERASSARSRRLASGTSRKLASTSSAGAAMTTRDSANGSAGASPACCGAAPPGCHLGRQRGLRAGETRTRAVDRLHVKRPPCLQRQGRRVRGSVGTSVATRCPSAPPRLPSPRRARGEIRRARARPARAGARGSGARPRCRRARAPRGTRPPPRSSRPRRRSRSARAAGNR